MLEHRSFASSSKDKKIIKMLIKGVSNHCFEISLTIYDFNIFFDDLRNLEMPIKYSK